MSGSSADRESSSSSSSSSSRLGQHLADSGGGGSSSNSNSSSNSGSNTKGVSSPIHSLRKKGIVVRQSIEEFFTNVHGALSELSSSNSSTSSNNNTSSNHHDSPPASPKSNNNSNNNSPLISSALPPLGTNFQRSNSNKQLGSASSTSSSSNSSPQSSNRSSLSQQQQQQMSKSLAKFYLLAQQIDYVHVGSSTFLKPTVPNNPMLPVENFSSILNVQWTTYWTIHLNDTRTVLDILKYVSQKTNREVKFLKMADCDGKILDHDYLLMSHRSKKFVVFEEIIIDPQDQSSKSGTIGAGPPNSDQRKPAPAPPPRSPSSYPVGPSLLHHTELISDPLNPADRPTTITHTNSNGSFGIGSAPSVINLSTPSSPSSPSSPILDAANVKKSPTTSPSVSRKNSKDKEAAAPGSAAANAANSPYQYCKFLDKVESANNPPTTEKGKILDNYFSHYYQELFKYIHQRSRRYQRVLDFCKESGLDECGAQAWTSKHFESESNFLRNKRAGMKLKEFKILTQIGKGGFGQVFLAIKKDTGDIVTLKRIKKQSYQWANQRIQVAQEKAVMSESSGKWITKLLYSFQDSQYLYLAMEYHCGGDFRALLNSLGTLSEEDARFYMAEMVEAVNSLHVLKFTHRDIKPSNFVIDKHGHIKLIDFGLSKEGIESRNGFNQKTMSDFRKSCMDGTFSFRSTLTNTSGSNGVVAYRRPTAHSAVGSPEYMAPEIVADEGYNHTCDYWSLGCVFMEMLCGFNPFCADTPNDVFINIIQWREVLDWPLFTQELSPEASDILKRMLCEPSNRFKSLEEFKSHPFFNRNGMTWETLLEQKPPFIPKVESDIDTSYFEDAVNNDPSSWDVSAEPDNERRDPFSNLNIPFFTYRKSSALNFIEHSLNYNDDINYG